MPAWSTQTGRGRDGISPRKLIRGNRPNYDTPPGADQAVRFSAPSAASQHVLQASPRSAARDGKGGSRAAGNAARPTRRRRDLGISGAAATNAPRGAVSKAYEERAALLVRPFHQMKRRSRSMSAGVAGRGLGLAPPPSAGGA